MDRSRASADEDRPGKLTLRERLDLLLDEDSLVERDALARHRATGFGLDETRPDTDGVVTGWGTVEGRRVLVFAHDARIFGGSLGEVFAAKVHKVLDLAESTGVPVVGLGDGGGARIQEGAVALAGFGGIFSRTVRLSGRPAGPRRARLVRGWGGVRRSPHRLRVPRPRPVAAVDHRPGRGQGGHGRADEPGGAGRRPRVHDADRGGGLRRGRRGGLPRRRRHLLSFLPSNKQEDPPWVAPTDDPQRLCPELLDLVPVEPHRAYDVRDVVECVVDDGELLEVHASWAANIVCALARLDGHVVGVVANQP